MLLCLQDLEVLNGMNDDDDDQKHICFECAAETYLSAEIEKDGKQMRISAIPDSRFNVIADSVSADAGQLERYASARVNGISGVRDRREALQLIHAGEHRRGG